MNGFYHDLSLNAKKNYFVNRCKISDPLTILMEGRNRFVTNNRKQMNKWEKKIHSI